MIYFWASEHWLCLRHTLWGQLSVAGRKRLYKLKRRVISSIFWKTGPKSSDIGSPLLRHTFSALYAHSALALTSSGLSSWELHGSCVDSRTTFCNTGDGKTFFFGTFLGRSRVVSSSSGRLVRLMTLLMKRWHQIRLVTASRVPWLILDYTKCHWQAQVIAPAVLNVVADAILFIYPFPIIFMAKIPNSLRYSLIFIFALCGFVTASAIVRVIIMTAGRFLDDPNNLYAYISSLSVLMADSHGGKQSRGLFHFWSPPCQ